jgi:hypothetical protein
MGKGLSLVGEKLQEGEPNAGGVGNERSAMQPLCECGRPLPRIGDSWISLTRVRASWLYALKNDFLSLSQSSLTRDYDQQYFSNLD